MRVCVTWTLTDDIGCFFLDKLRKVTLKKFIRAKNVLGNGSRPLQGARAREQAYLKERGK